MPFDTDRFLNSFLRITGKNVSEVLSINLTEYDSISSPIKKAEFVKLLMEDLSQNLQASDANLIMQSCGKQCLGNSTIQKAEKLFKESEGLDDFLLRLNENHIGGGELCLDGNTILGSYSTCYCGSISKSKEKIPQTYCYCSTGWFKRLFEEVLEKPVQVEILQTIASGSDKCLFRISM